MAKILGLDLGTNSVGWAVVEKADGKFSLIDKGVRIFQEGATAKERTTYRGTRKLYYRRRLRKINTLRLLSEYGFCPKISNEEFNKWQGTIKGEKKVFPVGNAAFLNWLRTDNQKFEDGRADKTTRKQEVKNPYYFRYLAVTEKLNLEDEDKRFAIGRAFYHLAQRRGFLSNSLDKSSEEYIEQIKSKAIEFIENCEGQSIDELKEMILGLQEDDETDKKIRKLFQELSSIFENQDKSDGEIVETLKRKLNDDKYDGKVKRNIKKLNKEIEDNKCLALGHLFYIKYQNREKIRNEHTDREQHYEKEFKLICKIQNIPNELETKLHNAIFYQRKLKSQKGLIGRCTLEKKKNCCPVSHPIYEEFKAWQYINNIKYRIANNENSQWQSLSNDFKDEMSKHKISSFFFNKNDFKFNKIIKKLDGAGIYQFNYQKERTIKDKDSLTVSASNTIGSLKSLFDMKEEKLRWAELLSERYAEKNKVIRDRETFDVKGHKTKDDVINDIWHVLYTYTNVESKKQFALNTIGLDGTHADKFASIKLKQGYADLSINAIKKILRFLKQGHIYSYAVFLANIETIIGSDNWKKDESEITKKVIKIIEDTNQKKKMAGVVNSLMRDALDLKYSPYENHTLGRKDKTDVLNKVMFAYGKHTWNNVIEEKEKEAVLNYVEDKYQEHLRNINKNDRKNFPLFEHIPKVEAAIKSYLHEEFFENRNDEITQKKLDKLYNPSNINAYPKVKIEKDFVNEITAEIYDKLKLPSPRVSVIKNPVAMRTLHQLKKIVEELVKIGCIDENTEIHIEVGREVNGANERKAIKRLQDERRNENERYAKLLAEFSVDNSQENKEKLHIWKEQIEPNKLEKLNGDIDNFIKEASKDKRNISKVNKLKEEIKQQNAICLYSLWDEQKGKCLYTGKSISITQLFRSDIEIEHTFPRSKTFDNSLQNKTVAFRSANQIKDNRIPYELQNYDDIKKRVKGLWKHKIITLKEQLERISKKVSADVFSTPEKKDSAIQEKFYLQKKLDYWTNNKKTGKYDRFFAKEIRSNFKNSQLVDFRIISKYACEYLNTFVSKKPFVVNGQQSQEFRSLWGLPDKNRSTHVHHCEDAIVIACMNYQYREVFLKEYYEKKEKGAKASLPKPWGNFTQYIKNELPNEVIISHYKELNKSEKQNRKKARKRGSIQYICTYKKDSNGCVLKDKHGNPLVDEYKKRPKRGKRLTEAEINEKVKGVDYFVVDKTISGRKAYFEYQKDEKGKIILENVPKYQQGDSVRGQLHNDTLLGKILSPFDNENHCVVRKALEISRKGFNVKNYKELRATINGEKKDKVGMPVDEVVRDSLLLLIKIQEKNKVPIRQVFSNDKDKSELVVGLLTPVKKNKLVNGRRKTVTVRENGKIQYQKDENGEYIFGAVIKKVRVIAQGKKPLKIKEFISNGEDNNIEYKQSSWAANKESFGLLIYEGGKAKHLLSLKEASNLFKPSAHVEYFDSLIRGSGDIILKKGLHVLMFLKNEVATLNIDKETIWERLYTITGLDTEPSCCIKLLHHKKVNHKLGTPKGGTKNFIKKMNEFPFGKVSINDFNALVEGRDFKISPLGKIEPMENN